MHRCTLQLQHIREYNAHTDRQARQAHSHSHPHTPTHTHTSHTFILLCKFACSCDSPAPKEAARFCHTQQGMDTEGVGGGSVKKSETMLHLGTTPASLCHPLFPLVTPRLEFILIFSSSWQRFYLHCFNLYLFCTLKITLCKGWGVGVGKGVVQRGESGAAQGV